MYTHSNYFIIHVYILMNIKMINKNVTLVEGDRDPNAGQDTMVA